MKIFNFFKKKDDQPLQKEIEKLTPKEVVKEEKTHEFIEQCQYLQDKYGLIIPDVYKDFFTKNKIDKQNIYYRIFWEP